MKQALSNFCDASFAMQPSPCDLCNARSARVATCFASLGNGSKPMGGPWAAHGRPMRPLGGPWTAHGRTMRPLGGPWAATGGPWAALGRPMGWAAHGAAHGRPMGGPWAAHGKPMGDPGRDGPWVPHGRPRFCRGHGSATTLPRLQPSQKPWPESRLCHGGPWLAYGQARALAD